jgi:hypothetical protein
MSTSIEVLFDSNNWDINSVEATAQQLADMVNGDVDSIYDAGREIEVEIITKENRSEVEDTLSDYIEELGGITMNISNK